MGPGCHTSVFHVVNRHPFIAVVTQNFANGIAPPVPYLISNRRRQQTGSFRRSRRARETGRDLRVRGAFLEAEGFEVLKKFSTATATVASCPGSLESILGAYS